MASALLRLGLFQSLIRSVPLASASACPADASDGEHASFNLVAARNGHTIFITTSNQAWGSGLNAQGQLGLGSSAPDKDSPSYIMDGVQQASVGDQHTLLIAGSDKVLAMGSNSHGQLGLGDSTSRYVPTPVDGNYEAVSAGYAHSLFLSKSTGKASSSGLNNNGQLGLGNTDLADVVTPVMIADTIRISAIAAGTFHSMFLTDENKVLVAGDNIFGQLGLADETDRHTPTEVPVLNANGDAQSIQAIAGTSHSLFLTTSGQVYATGKNNCGQLGLGDMVQRNTPQFVMDYVQAIAAGAQHSIFLRQDGQVYVAGSDDCGMLGLEGSPRLSPTLVMPSVKAVSAGSGSSFFLKPDGQLYATGNNVQGQLGLGDLSSRSSPLRICLDATTTSTTITIVSSTTSLTTATTITKTTTTTASSSTTSPTHTETTLADTTTQSTTTTSLVDGAWSQAAPVTLLLLLAGIYAQA